MHPKTPMTPSPEKPFEPTKPRDEMLLPEGMTCADCGWFMRCEGLGVAKLENVHCDWAPSRFAFSIRKAKEIKAELSTLRSQVKELQKMVDLYKRCEQKPTDFGQESASYNNY